MEAQTSIDFGASTYFIEQKLVQQYKLALEKKNTWVLIEIIDSWKFSSRSITHETNALDVAIDSHTS